jgi:hypothetical protein
MRSLKSSDQRQFAPQELAITKGQYDATQPEPRTPTWYDIALKERAKARQAAAGEARADMDKVEADKPKRRLVRRTK